MTSVAAIGEVMVELASAGQSPEGQNVYHQGYAGDTFNTAIYLARLGVNTSYVTRLGDDLHSSQILAHLTDENIDTNHIERVNNRHPGLYIIHNRADGERQFSYWRSESPARELFQHNSEKLFNELNRFDYLYLSGITLAIISDQSRDRLFDFLFSYRARGGKLVFDSNYRPQLWSSTQSARDAMSVALEASAIGLLTLEDESALWGFTEPRKIAEYYRGRGLPELAVKCGADPVFLLLGDEISSAPVPPVAKVIDTTGAGDSFNAGYLTARANGAGPVESVQLGNRCAACVIQRRGAVVDAVDFREQLTGGSITGGSSIAKTWENYALSI